MAGPERTVFDTNTILGFLKKYPGYPDLEVMYPDSDLFISEITEIELLSYWDIAPEEESNIKRLLSDVVVVPLTPEIKQKTILFRKSAKCKTPDSIIAATAILLDALLVTHDVKLGKVVFPQFKVVTLGVEHNHRP
jgi:predicted nucleic acid-binding protein